MQRYYPVILAAAILAVAVAVLIDRPDQDDTAMPAPRNIPGVASEANDEQAKFEYVLSLDNSGKESFLSEVFEAVKAHENNEESARDHLADFAGLSNVIAQLALDSDNNISSQSLFIINMLAVVPHTNSNLPNISDSAEIKTALEQLILGDAVDDDIRGAAIDAHSWLYPPQADLLSRFENIIADGGLNDGDTLTVIFGAYSKYKRLHDFDMPASTLEVTRELIDHPSDSVKANVINQLRESLGSPFLPVLFHELETSRNTSVQNVVIKNILLLDQSDETIRQLEKIAADAPGSGKERLIKRYTHPANIERFKSIAAKNNESNQQQ